MRAPENPQAYLFRTAANVAHDLKLRRAARDQQPNQEL
jgi:DNA-directed RNA polymerase specialized sigma24 family protein